MYVPLSLVNVIEYGSYGSTSFRRETISPQPNSPQPNSPQRHFAAKKKKSKNVITVLKKKNGLLLKKNDLVLQKNYFTESRDICN